MDDKGFLISALFISCSLWYIKIMKYRLLFLTVFILALVSCASGPLVVPEDMPPSKIIQKAQEATDINRYKLAIQYYQVLLERYGNNDEYYCIGEYEIAFIRYKQKRYAEARRGFENLLVLYGSEERKNLPPQFKVLSEKVLDTMNKKGY
jgi:outer membrane protein assembly factor BamD (BamD/ComL family)